MRRKQGAGGQRLAQRLARVDWSRVGESLGEQGYARLPGLLSAVECRQLQRLWDDGSRFRKHVDLERHRFGAGGAYRYFGNPLPPVVAKLRTRLYPPLARIANGWRERLGEAPAYPSTARAFLAECHAAGQLRPTPLLLRYEAGGYNRLHQDLYGALAFPLQATLLLSRPEQDFRGGEFLLLEQRPRMQSKGEAIALERGEAIVFSTRERPVHGSRGYHRAAMRHGVSRIHSGLRFTLGIIFHDAR